MSSVTKRNHYIPMCYTKNFAKEDGYLYQYDKEKTNIVSDDAIHPKDLGCIKRYYALKGVDDAIDNTTVEDFFQHGESSWPTLVAMLEGKETIMDYQLKNICFFLANMRCRVPNFILGMGKILSAHKKQSIINTMDLNYGIKITKNELEVTNPHKRSLIKSIECIETIYNELLTLNWRLIENTSEQFFVTTDNPLVYYNRQDSKNIPYKGGLNSEDVEVIFPVAKTLLLVGNRQRKEKFGYDTTNDITLVQSFNSRLIIAAERFIYSVQNNLVSLVRPFANLKPCPIINTDDHGSISFEPGLQIFNLGDRDDIYFS